MITKIIIELKIIFEILLLVLAVVARRDYKISSLGIVGGQIGNISRNPWFATLMIGVNENEKDIYYYCGSTIVSESILLSAGHCINDENIFEIIVRVGSNQYDEGGTTIKAAKAILHPRYNQTIIDNGFDGDFDIAIIKLQSDLIFDDKIQAVPIIDFTTHIPVNSTGIICGFGYDGLSSRLQKFLRCVNLTTHPWEYCNDLNDSLINDINKNNIICAGSSSNNFCDGDSGTGFIINKYLAGIASRSSCGYYDHVSTFISMNTLKFWMTDINENFTSYLDLIYDILNKNLNMSVIHERTIEETPISWLSNWFG